MAKGAANETQLAKMHALIAQVLSAQLGETVVVNPDEVDAGEDPVEMYTASPALITVAARFLKDNNIEADMAGEDSAGSEIKRRLEALQANRGKVVRLTDLEPVAQDG